MHVPNPVKVVKRSLKPKTKKGKILLAAAVGAGAYLFFTRKAHAAVAQPAPGPTPTGGTPEQAGTPSPTQTPSISSAGANPFGGSIPIREIQEALIMGNFMPAGGSGECADGKFGSNTRYAVFSYQQTQDGQGESLVTDGKPGPKTQASLRQFFSFPSVDGVSSVTSKQPPSSNPGWPQEGAFAGDSCSYFVDQGIAQAANMTWP